MVFNIDAGCGNFERPSLIQNAYWGRGRQDRVNATQTRDHFVAGYMLHGKLIKARQRVAKSTLRVENCQHEAVEVANSVYWKQQQ